MSEDNPLANVEARRNFRTRARPAGFADGVLARFATTEAAIAIAKRRRVRRVVWLATTAVTAIAATLVVVLVWPHSAETGSFVAAEPRELDVAGVTVELDRGASIAWTVEHGDVRVDQRGGATWIVPANRHLRVEIAGVGAVDATNATLHVEARMNLIDSRMIGATAVTAGLVAGLTATVIHGRADVMGPDRGATLKLDVGHSASVSPAEPVTVDVPSNAVAVQLVFSGNAEWFDNQILTVQDAVEHVELPPGSTIGATAYTGGNAMIMEALPPTQHFREIGRSSSSGSTRTPRVTWSKVSRWGSAGCASRVPRAACS